MRNAHLGIHPGWAFIHLSNKIYSKNNSEKMAVFISFGWLEIVNESFLRRFRQEKAL